MQRIKFIILLVSIIILGSLFVYVFNFRNTSISTETSTWGAFSDYLNAFVAIANLIVFIWLSWQVFLYNKNKDQQTEQFQRAIERPILIFKSDPVGDNGKELWKVYNIGNGAALNLKIAESTTRQILWAEPVTKCYSLGKGDSLQLDWLKNANVICITYEDIFETKYVTIGADDESFIQPLNEEFKRISIRDRDFNKDDFDKFMNLQTRRLAAAKISLTSFTTDQTTSPNG